MTLFTFGFRNELIVTVLLYGCSVAAYSHNNFNLKYQQSQSGYLIQKIISLQKIVIYATISEKWFFL